MMNGGMIFNSDCLENFTKINQSTGRRDLLHRILFFQGRPGILHPSSCMDIKWNNPTNDDTSEK